MFSALSIYDSLIAIVIGCLLHFIEGTNRDDKNVKDKLSSFLLFASIGQHKRLILRPVYLRRWEYIANGVHEDLV